MRYLITGTAKDISSSWHNTKRSLKIIFDSFEDYECLIVESNSSDNTLELLNTWAAEDSRRKILSLGNVSEPSRIKRIALCRNEYMKYLDNNISNFDYMLVVDLDSSLKIDRNFNKQINSCFERKNWDAIASNRRGRYYDIWALRSIQLGVTFDCWERVNARPDIFSSPTAVAFMKECILSANKSSYHDYVRHFVKRYQRVISENSDWIECQSAFGCMVLYKASSVNGRRYNGDTTCEHVSFNNGLKMFINPRFISGEECLEHL